MRPVTSSLEAFLRKTAPIQYAMWTLVFEAPLRSSNNIQISIYRFWHQVLDDLEFPSRELRLL